ncbi:MAG: hypothetical protein A3G18_10330 [Rhodospirillales bacterium RIFCSPLOWO2_12_FULL_58_28]|nr:MAG: hypothetical protein A3H92_08505 [Rhodospirillales bacterium RIFCSPLOWO2_02_FULL_58_16]OHC77675.1 MAG: hypothetical protein A3G18_10330 [Rhodospirillales bacterium RIFCSPLOWO2_12_FULL_58_28]
MIALPLAHLVLQAYADPDRVVDEVEWVVRPFSDGVALALRGTEDKEDWLDNMRVMPWWCCGVGWCHAGWLKGVNGAWPHILRDLYAYQGLPIYVAGHSKGGAEAAIVAAKLCAAGRAPYALVTFGAPKPGFAGLAGILNDHQVDIRRYVNGADGVPLTPVSRLTYRHPAPAIRIGRRRHPVSDHDMKRYIEALEMFFTNFPAGEP